MTLNIALKKIINEALHLQILLAHMIVYCMVQTPNTLPSPLMWSYFNKPSFKNWLKIRNELFFYKICGIEYIKFILFLILMISVE